MQVKYENSPKRKSSFLFYLGRFLSWLLFASVYRLKVLGVENIPDGGAIIAPNHQSFFDPPLMGASMPRDLHFMAKQELFKVPVLGFLIKRTNAFPIKRGALDMSAFRNAFDLLKKGELLLMFPEGTRSKDGNLGKARAGLGMVAVNAGVPVVPAKITGTNTMFKLKRITVTYGKPLMSEPLKDKDYYLEFSKKVVEAIAKLK
ncbi:MAG: 1-acyl-sn-glycerol-3-phosphate acyltransferase [Elusimicrobia bacterium]|nr:1-acyl-sn-glycerol-3-phosphate acyltransferase [Elusimicrobiota bacterium]